MGEKAPQAAVALAVGALAVHVLVALAPISDEGLDHFRRMLEIGVEDDAGRAARMIEPSGDRDFLAEIPAQGHARNGPR